LAERVAQILKENRRALYIGRVPDKYKRRFIELADEEFCGDYGMLLVHLMDVAGITDDRYNMLADRIDAIIEWIKQIEAKVEKTDDQKQIKTVSGRVLKKR